MRKQSSEHGHPRIRIREAAWKKLRAYIDQCPTEIEGLGTVNFSADGIFIIADVFLLEQEATAVEADISRPTLARFVTDWIQAGQSGGTLCFWWHSHAKMPVFWSPRDRNTIDGLIDGNILISYVGNHLGEYFLRFDAQDPFRIALDEIPLEIIPELDEALLAQIRDEIAQKVTPPRRFLERQMARFTEKFTGLEEFSFDELLKGGQENG